MLHPARHRQRDIREQRTRLRHQCWSLRRNSIPSQAPCRELRLLARVHFCRNMQYSAAAPHPCFRPPPGPVTQWRPSVHGPQMAIPLHQAVAIRLDVSLAMSTCVASDCKSSAGPHRRSTYLSRRVCGDVTLLFQLPRLHVGAELSPHQVFTCVLDLVIKHPKLTHLALKLCQFGAQASRGWRCRS